MAHYLQMKMNNNWFLQIVFVCECTNWWLVDSFRPKYVISLTLIRE